MKTNNRLNELRASQRAELAKVNKRLAEIEKFTTEFRNTPAEERKESKEVYYNCMNEAEKLRKIQKQLVIEVAEKKYANNIMYSDIEPYEVIEEKTDSKYLIRAMRCTEKKDARKARMESFCTGGFAGHFDNDLQDWEIESDTTAEIIEIRKHKDGYFYYKGLKFSISDTPVKKYDFNF